MKRDTGSEIAGRADFSRIRYAQCWEDADILVEALDAGSGRTCLSIASAGDNALALLAGGAEHVVALDLNPAQLACLALRVCAYRELSHGELLELMGSRASRRRRDLYRRCRPLLDSDHRAFWDAHGTEIDQGIGSAGRFERYFTLFRTRIMPLIHSRATIKRLLEPMDRESREHIYDTHWDNWRWRLLFRIFFSRFVMGRMGRDPGFFRYVEGDVAARILGRTRYALTQLAPAENPYLHWILTGTHGDALPLALRESSFERIRDRLDDIEWHQSSIEDYLAQYPGARFDAFNLSDIFEYMSQDNYEALLRRLIDAAHTGARLAYWNMLVARRRPAHMADQLQSMEETARALHAKDKAFFYSDFIVEVRR
jgi:S-adenosylmethionine-diacylglycerol 3-amino-3-carboxypropyl transferase